MTEDMTLTELLGVSWKSEKLGPLAPYVPREVAEAPWCPLLDFGREESASTFEVGCVQ